jgi:hypothetical protein
MKKKTNKKHHTDPLEIPVRLDQITRRLFLFCLLFAFLLFLLDAFVNYAQLTEIGAVRRLFNITREDSLASWFGTTLTFMVALTLWFIVLVKRRSAAPAGIRRGWLVLAVFFTYLAVDDGAEIHERLGSTLKAISESASPGALSPLVEKILHLFPSYPWQVLFAPVLGIMCVFLVLFLWSELPDPRLRRLLVIALACMLLALCFDFVEGLESRHPWNLHTVIEKKCDLDNYTVRHFAKSIEESTEILGMTLFWMTFLGYLGTPAGKRVHFHFQSRTRENNPSS